MKKLLLGLIVFSAIVNANDCKDISATDIEGTYFGHSYHYETTYSFKQTSPETFEYVSTFNKKPSGKGTIIKKGCYLINESNGGIVAKIKSKNEIITNDGINKK